MSRVANTGLGPVVVDANYNITGEAPAQGETIPTASMLITASGAVGSPVCAAFARMAEVPVFNIRNDDIKDAKCMFVKSSIPAAYHWVKIAALNSIDGEKYFELFIRCALARFADRLALNITEESKRKMAIAMGTVRAIVTTYYCIADDDLIPEEATAPYLVINPASVGSTNAEPVITEKKNMKFFSGLNPFLKKQLMVMIDRPFEKSMDVTLSQE